jgi:hypothetical protein
MRTRLSLDNVLGNMRAKLEAVVRYDEMKENFDLITLIKSIKGLSYQV